MSYVRHDSHEQRASAATRDARQTEPVNAYQRPTVQCIKDEKTSLHRCVLARNVRCAKLGLPVTLCLLAMS